MTSQSLPFDQYTVYVVDDDVASATAITRLLGTAGYVVRTYTSAVEFLKTFQPSGTGCIILDLWMPDVSGLEIQQAIAGRADQLPIIFLTGHADVPDSVRAIRGGAIDFLLKPVEPQLLLDAVARALAKNAADREVRLREDEMRSRYERLTAREREVFAHLIRGQLNKQVGADLQISERTVKLHRARIFEKLEVNSMAGLTRLAMELRIDPKENS